ncbi:MAG: hypothetical protein RI897_114 [Verrucomicrobiota bacterium]
MPRWSRCFYEPGVGGVRLASAGGWGKNALASCGYDRLIYRSVARVAQLDRASASGAEGCGFDPRLAYHFLPGWF